MERSTDRGATEAIAAWVAGASLEAMPPDVVEKARAGVIDTVGVILAGVDEPVTRIAAGLAAEDGGVPAAAQLGTTLRTAAETAALLNGVSGHALDYDDVSASLTGHPSVVVLPAALAAAELAGASGAALLEAYVAGVEVTAKLGLAIGPAHYRAGWHATSTLGTIGAAAAAGKVLGLDAERLTHALAIAVSLASGSRQNFGTMTKPFHAGHAARCGLAAARLAARGMTGDTTAIEAPLGLFALLSFGEGRAEEVAPSLGRPYDLASAGLSVKKYPCCFATHRAADAVLDLRAEHGLDAGQVDAVAVTVPVGGVSPLIHDRPRTGLEGKFSMQYVLAAAVLDGRVGLDTFRDDAVRRPEAQALVPSVIVREDPTIETGANPIEEGHVTVDIRLRGGAVLTRRVAHPRGSPADPLRPEELAAKFTDCARAALPADQAEHALTRLLTLERAPDARALVAALTPAAVATAG
ncbi:MAG TPA: MmgE/PrpD family protein [Candidatus Dormibacteraeota bacterium]|nr:MmgE/PrpD family protein [Candidatus Dormibacteraeota bacterium]